MRFVVIIIKNPNIMTVINLNDQVLKLRGTICSEDVAQTQKIISSALSQARNLILKLDKIQEVDLEGVYMLYLLQQEALKRNKCITITGIKKPNVRDVFELAGMQTNKIPA